MGTRLVRRHVFDLLILECLEKDDDFADVPFELADVAAHFANLLDRLAQSRHDRFLKRRTTFRFLDEPNCQSKRQHLLQLLCF